MTDAAARIHATLDRLAGDCPALGVAVSGGGDSIALMHLLADWSKGRRIMVATVDHGLRPGSAAEAQTVHRAATALGLHHTTLRWQRDNAEGNLMAQARDARLRLLSGWALRHDLPAVALGHTRDDQAETLMMRLARGSGIDGLSGMAERRQAFDVTWLRPMLGVGRQDLRDWLVARQIDWIDDPSNENEDFDRVRIRKAIAAMGLDAQALARAADHIRDARSALSHYAAKSADSATARNGALTLPRDAFRDAPPEIGRRLLIAGCRWITGADYPPRRATVQHALAAISAGSRVTLDGAIITPSGDRLRLAREPAASLRSDPSPGPLWDNRWRITGLAPGQVIAAIGTAPLPDLDWRSSGLPRDEAAASPGIWQDGRLQAAPLLRPVRHISVTPLRGAADFRSLVISD